MLQAPAATAASASAPLSAPRERSPGLVELQELERKCGNGEAPPPLVPAPIPNQMWNTLRPQPAPLPLPGFIPPPLSDPAPTGSLSISGPHSNQEHKPRPQTVQATNPKRSPSQVPPTCCDDNGDRCALTVPHQCSDSHRVADSAFEAPYFCRVRVSWEYLLSRGAACPGEHRQWSEVRMAKQRGQSQPQRTRAGQGTIPSLRPQASL